jgi:hypothetical protein
MSQIKGTLSLMLVALLAAGPAFAQQDTTSTRVKVRGVHFVDANGDGYNDNAPDADGDGIPNGLDPDYLGARRMGQLRGFVDEDGDGLNDYAQDADGDGIPNGIDPDYDGAKMMHGFRGFVDLDGDGINDNARMRRGAGGGAFGSGFGYRNGIHAQTGTALQQGAGEGNGPKGRMQQRGNGPGGNRN